jgi:hypothetical protein
MDWFWATTDGSGRIYSGMRNALVAATDIGYSEFLNYGKLPAPWPVDTNGNQTTQSLQAILPFGVVLPFT